MNDRDCLRMLARSRNAEALRHLMASYGPLIYASAVRRMGPGEAAERVTRATFFVLSRRARRLSKKTVLAGWLFRVARVASRKLAGATWTSAWRRWLPWQWLARAGAVDATAVADGRWRESLARIDSPLDRAIDQLPKRHQDAVLLRVFMNLEAPVAAQLAGVSERRLVARVHRASQRIERRLRKWGLPVEPGGLARMVQIPAALTAVPSAARVGLAPESVLKFPANEEGAWADEIAATQSPRGSTWGDLARRTLTTLAVARWRRRLLVGIVLPVALFVGAIGTLFYIDSRSGHSRSIAMFIVWSMKHEARSVPGLSEPARAWPDSGQRIDRPAIEARTAADLFRTTNIWLAYFQFTRQQWDGLEPTQVEPLPYFLKPDGTALLRNPKAKRSGLAGVLGYDFPWSAAGLELGGAAFTNIAVRVKGNGTYLGSLYGDKRSFKVDLNKNVKSQQLGGLDELNFHNMVNDYSCMSDALAYEFFRQAGVPAPRTAYAYLSVSVEGQWHRYPLGLYVWVESVDGDFLRDRFGSRRVPLFKPVTYELFHYLGDDWAAYADIYDLKSEAKPEQLRRLIELAKLVTQADDATFAARIGDYLDLKAFSLFLASQVLLSNYDGPLSDGQNFYVYLDPTTDRFAFIPWDLDLSWGGFFLLGTPGERERASIWHPWAGRNRFLERMLAAENFRTIYRADLEELLTRVLVPKHWHQRVDELSRVLRSPVAAESNFRRIKFEESLGNIGAPELKLRDQRDNGINRPANQIKRFVTKRAASVRAQLDGESDGVILEHRRRR